MVEKQVTIMVLKVDLQCWKCYKKVKKILCKFPQIQDQVFDEKQNTVTIRVVCCSPDKIMRKIVCKGGESIKSINVKVPEKPNKETPDNQGKNDNKKPPNAKPNASQPNQKPDKPDKKTRNSDNSKGDKPQDVPPPPPAPAPVPVPVYLPPVDPFRTCCIECYEGRDGGPCLHGGYGWPSAPPCYQYDGYLGRPVYDSYGGGRGNCYLVCEESSGPLCRIM